MSDTSPQIPYSNPTLPKLLTEETRIRFQCYPEIACFNACCKRADITLTPYDIVRLKHLFNVDSSAFLKEYTVPFQMDSDGLPGVKLRTTEEGACIFLDFETGCAQYAHRPIVCRYYPLALLNLREKDAPEARAYYSLIQETHCHGHQSSFECSIADYRQQQGCVTFDDYDRDWYHLILKKKSAGPSVGRPSAMSLQLFFMACYDLDRFRRFVLSENFQKSYQLTAHFYAQIAEDDFVLLVFAFQFLRHVLFGEQELEETAQAWENRLAARRELWALRTQAELAQQQMVAES